MYIPYLHGDVMLTSLKSCHSPCTWHCHHAAERDSRVYPSRDVTTQFVRFESGGLQHLGILQERVCRSQIHDVEELKERLLREWRLLDMHTIIAAAIAQWRSHLNACVRMNGGHFQHKFWGSDFLLWFVCFIDTGFRKCDRYKHVQSANVGVKCVACPSVRPFDTRQFIYSFIKAPLATARAHLRIGSVHLFDVCLSVVKMRTQKRDFLKK